MKCFSALRAPIAATASEMAGRNGIMIRTSVAQSFLTSPESYLRTVDGFYAGLLGRGPDRNGEQTLLDALTSARMTTDQVAEFFLASEEFFAKAFGT